MASATAFSVFSAGRPQGRLLSMASSAWRPKKQGFFTAAVVATATAAGVATAAAFASEKNDDTRLLSRGAGGVVRSCRALATGVACVADYQVQAWWSSLMEADGKRDPDFSAVHARSARRLLALCRANGGVYCKFGQHVGSLSHLVPPEYVETLRELHDNCEPSQMPALEKMFVSETGSTIADTFASFDTDPVGVASLAQVHRAVLPDGRVVAVKLQHPSIAAYSAIDVWLATRFARLVKGIFSGFKLEWIAREMESNLPSELDFCIEGKNANELRMAFRGSRVPIKVPLVHWSTRRVLVMEFVEGVKIDDRHKLIESGISPSKVSLSLAEIFSEMIFKHGFLHSDPHPGNILVIQKPKKWFSRNHGYEICILDHGLYKRLDLKFRKDYALFWLAVFDRNEEKIKQSATNLCSSERLHTIFASIVTGRSWEAIKSGVTSERTANEARRVRDAAQQYLREVAEILATVSPQLLLVLKTNELLRDNYRRLGAPEFATSVVFYKQILEVTGGSTLMRWLADIIVKSYSMLFFLA